MRVGLFFRFAKQDNRSWVQAFSYKLKKYEKSVVDRKRAACYTVRVHRGMV